METVEQLLDVTRVWLEFQLRCTRPNNEVKMCAARYQRDDDKRVLMCILRRFHPLSCQRANSLMAFKVKITDKEYSEIQDLCGVITHHQRAGCEGAACVIVQSNVCEAYMAARRLEKTGKVKRVYG